jgi:hypothetical protein
MDLEVDLSMAAPLVNPHHDHISVTLAAASRQGSGRHRLRSTKPRQLQPPTSRVEGPPERQGGLILRGDCSAFVPTNIQIYEP